MSLGGDSPSVTVGRNPDCLIQTAKPSVSRRHSEFTYSGGAFEVADLGSSNGTFINGREIRRQTLRDRDEVKCGDFVIRFFLDQEDGASPSHSGYDRPSTPLSASYEPSPTQMPGDSGSYAIQQGAGLPTGRSSSAYGQAAVPPPRSSSVHPSVATPYSAGDADEVQVLRRDNQALREQLADQEAIIAVMRDGAPVDEAAESKRLAAALEEELKKVKIEAEEAKLEIENRADANQDLQREVDQKKLMIESYQERYERLKEQAEGQIAQLDDYRAELQAKTEAVEDLEHRVEKQDEAADKANIQLAEYSDAAADLKVRINQLERQLEEAQRNTKLTDFELKKVRQEADNLRTMIDSEGSENAGLLDNVTRLRQVLEAKETEIIANERRIEELEGELEPFRAGEVGAGEIEGLNDKIREQQETIASLNEKLGELNVHLEDARAHGTTAAPEDSSKAHEELERAKRRCRRLETKVDNLQAKLDEGGDGPDPDKLDELKKKNHALRQRIRELEQSSGTTSSTNLDVSRFREMIGELKDLRSENAELKTDLDMLRLEQATGGTDSEASEELERLREHNKALQQDVDNLIAESRTRGTGSPDEAASLSSGSTRARAESVEQIESLTADIERLRSQLKARPRPEELEDLRSDNAKLSDAVARLERDLDSAAAIDVAPATELKDAQQRAQKLEARLEELDAELQDLRARAGDTNVDDSEVDELRQANAQLRKALDEAATSRSTLARVGSEDSGLVEGLNDHVSQLRNNFRLIVDYVADIEKVYDALKRADLSQLSTLDRVRIEKTIREAEPDVTFEELGNMLGDCVSSSEEMKTSLLKFKRDTSS